MTMTRERTYKSIPIYTYDCMDLSDRQLSEDQTKHFRKHNDLKGCVYLTHEIVDSLIKESIQFSIIPLNIKPYKKDSYALVELILNYSSTFPISLYIDIGLLGMLVSYSEQKSIYKPKQDDRTA
ncbi:hypothetical protein [Sporosarcina sp. FSL W7-1283]|uniref:hypothetical protein n=1 Tax=Sporosarcina sp. FSL W7-1283 TaxID=2921560 RepID=UPI0030F98F3F